MPILLPVLVRRSVRETTVAATRPALAPAFTERRELGPGLHLQLLQQRGVVVERMAGEEEADRLVFALQPVGRQPGLDRRQSRCVSRLRRAAEQCRSARPWRPRARAARSPSWRRRRRCARARLRLERVEGAGRDQAFQHALVDGARIDAARRNRRGRANGLLAARLDDRFDRLRADALERGERVEDRVALDLEGRRPSG